MFEHHQILEGAENEEMFGKQQVSDKLNSKPVHLETLVLSRLIISSVKSGITATLL